MPTSKGIQHRSSLQSPPELPEANPISRQFASASPQQRLELLAPPTASIPLRFVAKLCDWLFTGALYLFLVGLWVAPMDWVERSAAISFAVFLALPALWFMWCIYTVLLNGRTLGKRFFGLVVLTETWEPLSPGRNFGRVWAETLSGGLLGLGYLVAIFDLERRALHDHLCGTRVVLSPPR